MALNTSRASTIEGYVQAKHNLFAEQRSRESSSAVATGPSTFIPVRNRYKPTGEKEHLRHRTFSARHVTDVVLAILTAVSVSIDKEIGTTLNFVPRRSPAWNICWASSFHTLARGMITRS